MGCMVAGPLLEAATACLDPFELDRADALGCHPP